MHIRKAVVADAPELTAILNEIIRAGGTTALETELSPEDFDAWFISGPHPLCCYVAEADGMLFGFQSLSRYGVVSPGWADIATFARMSPKKPGVGRALFAATRSAARDMALAAINATIRADNVSGLGYYGRMGFQDYDRLSGVALLDGTPVDRLKKRYLLSGNSA